MDDRATQTLYLRRRASESLAMAVAAAGPCARIAHLTLARLYGEAVVTLLAQPSRALFVNARGPVDGRVYPRQMVPLVRNMAAGERRLVSLRPS